MTKFVDKKETREIELLSPIGVWTMIKIKGHREYFTVYHLKEEEGKYTWGTELLYGNDLKGMKTAYRNLNK